ncbi:MAG: hypothetical protein IJ817_03775 [Clostridia bacterium]|nr:hypothetical protein [Clostridia bacterium]
MEKIDFETETEIEENQISFDFLKQNEDTQTLLKPENTEWIAKETLVVVIKSNGRISANFDLCGKKMIDWVLMATAGCQQKVIDEPEDLLSSIRSLAENFEFVAVLYSDTPLLSRKTFNDVMNYFSTQRLNVLTLARGYVFKTQYLQNAKMIMSSGITPFGKEDFDVVDSAEKVSHAFDVLNKRILDYHKQNGVVLFGENTIFIDADVEIEEGSVIYPNNTIKGESYIGKNVILESGNYILDTIVCDEAFVCQSYLEKSKIEKGKVVGPFERLINQKY